MNIGNLVKLYKFDFHKKFYKNFFKGIRLNLKIIANFIESFDPPKPPLQTYM